MGETPIPPLTLVPPRLSRALRIATGGALLLLLARLGVPACPMAAFTGHPCPGCGMTRATLALLHGHLAEAVGFHPLAPLVVPLFGGFLLYGAVQYVREGRWPATRGQAGAQLAAGALALWVLLMVVWVARFCGAFGGPVAV